MIESSSSHQVQTLPSSYLNQVPPGARLQLQVDGPVAKRFSGKLVGFENNDYLLIKASDVSNWLDFDRHIFPGAALIIRMLIENERGQCVAFSSDVRWIAQHPFKLLYVDFPKSIEKADLRLYPRVRTSLRAKLSNVTSEPVDGVLEDVSLGGCRFTFDLPKGKTTLAKGQVTITAGKQFFMKADVCNQRNIDSKRCSVGMAFNAGIDDVMQGLNRLNIAKEPLLTSAQLLS